ncbi:MAG: MmcQ/YjbR family DNA-binding protein [Clostridia bacterium]|nr:MmcQ/YjbR family DNA-binding protein [Clostridia bacterium]
MNRNEIIDYISLTYGADAEHPFLQYPDTAVFRHSNNKKWFAVIINVAKTKLGIDEEGTADIINLKCDPILTGSLRNEKGFYPAYHMNKTNWISAFLNGEADEEKIKWLIDVSFDLTAKKVRKVK